MPTPTYDLLDSTTLGTSAASVTFSGISGSYRDLVLVIDKLGTSTIGTEITFNGDTGSNYPYVWASGNGSSASTGSGTESSVRPSGNANATTRKQIICEVMDYSATDKHKSVLVRSNVASSPVVMHTSRWANTSAITSITIDPIINQFAASSTFYLYGVSA